VPLRPESPSAARNCLEELAAGIHAKAISPHSLRHTFAIRYLRATGNLMALRSLLGRASVATTQL
jgi:integrase/recombinase XerD